MHIPERTDMKELVGFAALKPNKVNKEIVKTDGWTIYYSDGSTEFDRRCGGSSFILGYNNKAVVEGIEQKVLDVARCQSNDGAFTDDTKRAGEVLTQGVWDYYSWALSGTSAVEAAISMNDEYWKKQNKNKPGIMCFSFAWHGSSYLTKDMGAPFLLHNHSGRVINIQHPRWVTKDEQQASEQEALNTLLNRLNDMPVGCIVFDSATLLNNVCTFSQNWWETIRSICDDNDILMITDDVASCWGKANAYHPYQTFGYGIQPDISAVGKALAAGYAPIGAALCNSKVGDMIRDSWNFNHTQHPYMLGIYMMLNTYDYIEKHGLMSNNITQRLTEVGDQLVSEGVLTNYRCDGLFISCDHIKKAPHSGLSSNFNDVTINICAPLTANDQYFSDLKDYMYERLL